MLKRIHRLILIRLMEFMLFIIGITWLHGILLGRVTYLWQKRRPNHSL